jgi:hypothetical protein
MAVRYPGDNQPPEVTEMDHSNPRHKAVQLVSGGMDDGPAAEHGRRLAGLAAAMDAPTVFRKGQFVRWKPGLRNRTLPAYNESAVVREVLTAPVFETCEASQCAASPYFGEPLTLVLAVLDKDGDFLEFRYDGRRLEPVDA